MQTTLPLVFEITPRPLTFQPTGATRNERMEKWKTEFDRVSKLFFTVFGHAFRPYWNPIMGLDIVKFDEHLERWDKEWNHKNRVYRGRKMSVDEYVATKYGKKGKEAFDAVFAMTPWPMVE